MTAQVRLWCFDDDCCPCDACHLADYCGGVYGGSDLWCASTMFVLVVSVTSVCFVVVLLCCRFVVLPNLGFFLFNIIGSFPA